MINKPKEIQQSPWAGHTHTVRNTQKCSASLSIKDRKIKTEMRLHSEPVSLQRRKYLIALSVIKNKYKETIT